MDRQLDERDDKQSAGANLGSLAQSARVKNLNTARWVMIAVGVLTIAVNGFLLFTAREQLMNEVRKNNMVIVDQAEFDKSVAFARLIFVVPIVLGVIFIVLGILVKKYPVPMTITGLVLYILSTLAFAALNPMSLAQGFIIKIIIIVALVKAVQAAMAYQRESAEALWEPE